MVNILCKGRILISSDTIFISKCVFVSVGDIWYYLRKDLASGALSNLLLDFVDLSALALHSNTLSQEAFTSMVGVSEFRLFFGGLLIIC